MLQPPVHSGCRRSAGCPHSANNSKGKPQGTGRASPHPELHATPLPAVLHCPQWKNILDGAVSTGVRPSCSSVLHPGFPILSKHAGRGGREVQAAVYLPDSILWHRTTNTLRACVVISWEEMIRVLISPLCMQLKWKVCSRKNLKWPMLARFWNTATWAAIHLTTYSCIHST